MGLKKEGSMKPLTNYFHLFISILFQSLSFMFSKFAATEVNESYFLFTFINKYYLIALVCLMVQSLFWQLTLKKLELSIAYPLTAVNNLFILIISYYMFNESITWNNIIGVMIIMVGIIIPSFNSEKKW